MSQLHRRPLSDVSACPAKSRYAVHRGPEGNPAWTPVRDPDRCHGCLPPTRWVQSCPQVLVQNAPQRTFSWGSSFFTPSFSRRIKAQAARPGASIRETSPPLTNVVEVQHLFRLQQGALLKYTYKTHWLTLEKQAPKRRGKQVPRCTPDGLPWCMESVWLPSFDSLLPLPSTGAAGAVSGNYGVGCGSSGQVVQAAARALLARKFPGWAGCTRASKAPR